MANYGREIQIQIIYLARVELGVHLAAHVVHVVVHHGQGDAHGEHGHGLKEGTVMGGGGEVLILGYGRSGYGG